MTRAARTVALACLLVSVAGLGAAPVAASIATKKWKPPCSVVKEADVGEILGTSIARTSSEPGAVPSCQYFDGSSDQAVVSIWLNGKPLGPASNTFSFDSDQAKGNDINRNFQTVSHIGKKAFFFESDGLNRLEVLVGKRLFFVDGPTLTLDQATAIAKRVIAKT